MYSQQVIIKQLLQLTHTMNRAIIKRDLDVLEQMLQERAEWLGKYDALSLSDFNEDEQNMVDEMLALDKENNILLEKLVEKAKTKVESTGKEKNDIKKKTNAAKKYVSVGTNVGGYSKFNKKT